MRPQCSSRSGLPVSMLQYPVRTISPLVPSSSISTYDYPDPNGNTVPLILPLPSSKMLQDAQGALGVPQPYPLSRFYAIAFGGVSEGALIPAELLKFELRRLGEYVILQCQ